MLLSIRTSFMYLGPKVLTVCALVICTHANIGLLILCVFLIIQKTVSFIVLSYNTNTHHKFGGSGGGGGGGRYSLLKMYIIFMLVNNILQVPTCT